jgi:asparaginyl-tRNA synthetase
MPWKLRDPASWNIEIWRKLMRIREIFTTEARSQELHVQGWVRTKRDSKQVVFLELNDGSCLKNLQLVCDKEHVDENILNKINTGASVSVHGNLEASPGKNQSVEVHVKQVELVGNADQETYPLQKKRHSFEFLREIAHLRPRTNTIGAVTRVKNTICYAIHSFFNERDFYYVHSPIVATSDAEGAGEMFQVTTLNLKGLNQSDKPLDYSQDFFGKPAFLSVSGQLQAEAYATAMGRVYTFGPTFRAENSNTTRHLAEFWMIEPEMAFCDLECNMDLAEEFVKSVIQAVLDRNTEDMDFFNKWIEPGKLDVLNHVLQSDFIRITYTEAVEKLQQSGKEFEYPIEWGKELQTEHERFLTEELYKAPVIVTDYPKDCKAFYMRQNDDGKTVAAMDVLLPGIGEVIGGSQREERFDRLSQRIEEMGLEPEHYQWYLDLRRFGTVPHSGFGLGLERLVLYITGMKNIKDVIPFPRSSKNAEF